MTSAYSSTWSTWSDCSQSCDIGTRSRENYDEHGQLQDTETEYCNTQYCPGKNNDTFILIHTSKDIA